MKIGKEVEENLTGIVEKISWTVHVRNEEIQRDSKRWTQFRTSIFPELYMVCG